LGTAILVGQIWHDDAKAFVTRINWHSILNVALRFKKFPLYSTWAGLLSTISLQLPALLLSSFFSAESAGYYSLGNRILRLPAQLIGAAISQVLFQRASKAANDGTLGELVEVSFTRLVTLGMFPFLLLAVMGRESFSVVYGIAWSEAGVYSQILAIWTFFTFIGAPLTTINIVLERQEVNLVFNISLFLTRLASLIIGGVFGSPRLALILFSITGTFSWIWYTFWITDHCGIPLTRSLSLIGRYLLTCSPLILLIALLKWVFMASGETIFFVSVALMVIYYSIILIRDNEIRLLIISLLPIRKKD
jgi:O-antigen/teichoic acid export membrane protein